jgi:hypothetical protein
MRSALRVLLLWTAGLLLFAHSVVPHAHGSEHASSFGADNLVSERHSEKPLPIEADLGSDHLEHFRLDEEDNAALGAFVATAAILRGFRYVRAQFTVGSSAQLEFFPPALELRTLPFEACAGIRPPPTRL